MRLIFSVMAIAAILLVTAGCTQNSLPVPGPENPSLPGDSTTAGGRPGPVSCSGREGDRRLLVPLSGPERRYLSARHAGKGQIPWKKINRLYIGFATVKDGVLTDLPPGDSAEDTARRAEMQRRIREIVPSAGRNNPDAEIFIVSNFDEKELDPQYLLAAEDPQKFADSVVAYLKAYDLDGYDMDWESQRIDDYAPQLTSLLSTCHDHVCCCRHNSARPSLPPDPHGLAGSRIPGDGRRPEGQRGPAQPDDLRDRG